MNLSPKFENALHFRQAGNSPLIDELDRVVTELEHFAIKPAGGDFCPPAN